MTGGVGSVGGTIGVGVTTGGAGGADTSDTLIVVLGAPAAVSLTSTVLALR
jgi:hypothetical protein